MPSRTPPPSHETGLTYRDAGVDIDAGDDLVEAIKPLARATLRPEVLAGIGGFGAAFALPKGYTEPVLVSGTDGVGTKLKLTFGLNRHDTVGIDLVAMSVNDVVVQGAEPLFFLDYFATGHLEPGTAQSVIRGIAEGCQRAGCALIGGETAEMPGMYPAGEYDLAGFCVGIAEKGRLIDGRSIRAGDALIGIASSGPHSNGYSLVRKIVEVSGARFDAPFEGRTLGDALIEPTRIYVKPLLALMKALPVHGLAHITGGGIPGNVPRMIPDGLKAVLDGTSWPEPPIFRWLRETGRVARDEMHRTFNCGMGMVVMVDASDATRTIQILESEGEQAFLVGRIERGEGEATAVVV